MTIIDKIKNTVAPIMDGRFVYDSEAELNTILDGEQFPLAFMTLVESGAVNDSLGRFSERMTIDMHFATLADQDMEGEANEVLLDELKQKALGEWLPAVRQESGLRLVSVNSTRRIYMRFSNYDTVLTAYVVNCTIDDATTYGKCK